MQLPATDKLADTWGTSYSTIHNALQKLVKKGWIERLDGSGTPLPLCPFPATWAMLRLIDRQFAGETTGPINVNHSFEDLDPLV